MSLIYLETSINDVRRFSVILVQGMKKFKLGIFKIVCTGVYLKTGQKLKYLINNPKKFNVGIDDLGAKPCIPHKSLLQ